MKIFYLLLELASTVISCIASGFLYLKGEYNMSALLTVSWILSLTMWIRSSGLLEDKKTETGSTREAS